MSAQMYTQFPTTSQANLSDIILAVQGYVNPENLGISTQETLQQVFNLFLDNTLLFNQGNPNGVVTGQIKQLCYDTINGILYVCEESGTAWVKSITLTGGTGINISQSGNNIQISATAEKFNWNEISGTSATMVSNNGYTPLNGSLTTLTLPLTSSYGDVLQVAGYGAGGWIINTNAGQSIIIGNATATTSVASTNQYDCIQLYCVVASTVWQAYVAPQGELSVT